MPDPQPIPEADIEDDLSLDVQEQAPDLYEHSVFNTEKVEARKVDSVHEDGEAVLAAKVSEVRAHFGDREVNQKGTMEERIEKTDDGRWTFTNDGKTYELKMNKGGKWISVSQEGHEMNTEKPAEELRQLEGGKNFFDDEKGQATSKAIVGSYRSEGKTIYIIRSVWVEALSHDDEADEEGIPQFVIPPTFAIDSTPAETHASAAEAHDQTQQQSENRGTFDTVPNPLLQPEEHTETTPVSPTLAVDNLPTTLRTELRGAGTHSSLELRATSPSKGEVSITAEESIPSPDQARLPDWQGEGLPAELAGRDGVSQHSERIRTIQPTETADTPSSSNDQHVKIINPRRVGEKYAALAAEEITVSIHKPDEPGPFYPPSGPTTTSRRSVENQDVVSAKAPQEQKPDIIQQIVTTNESSTVTREVGNKVETVSPTLAVDNLPTTLRTELRGAGTRSSEVKVTTESSEGAAPAEAPQERRLEVSQKTEQEKIYEQKTYEQVLELVATQPVYVENEFSAEEFFAPEIVAVFPEKVEAYTLSDGTAAEQFFAEIIVRLEEAPANTEIALPGARDSAGKPLDVTTLTKKINPETGQAVVAYAFRERKETRSDVLLNQDWEAPEPRRIEQKASAAAEPGEALPGNSSRGLRASDEEQDDAPRPPVSASYRRAERLVA